MSNDTHDEIQDLLAAYAVNAVDGGERSLVEAHLEDCDECRSELREHLEVTSRLGTYPAGIPEGVWERVESALSVPPPPIRLVDQSRSNWARLATLAASVAALILAATLVVLPRSEAPPGEAQLAQAALKSPGARAVELRSDDGRLKIAVVVKADGTGYLHDGNLPALPPDRIYQLWEIADGQAVSAGLLGTSVNVRPFSSAPGAKRLAITEELAGGVVASTQTPVVSGAIPA